MERHLSDPKSLCFPNFCIPKKNSPRPILLLASLILSMAIPQKAMADRRSNQRAPRHAAVASPATATAANNSLAGDFLRKLHEHVPDSSQLLGFLTLFISSGILLLLTGLTITLSVTGLIFLTPLIILTIPLWVPVAALVLLAAAGLASVGGFSFATMAGLSWLYKYFRGFHPPGSERADYARDRIYDTARHVKDYAREYGGYLQGKLKDVAPGA